MLRAERDFEAGAALPQFDFDVLEGRLSGLRLGAQVLQLELWCLGAKWILLVGLGVL